MLARHGAARLGFNDGERTKIQGKQRLLAHYGPLWPEIESDSNLLA